TQSGQQKYCWDKTEKHGFEQPENVIDLIERCSDFDCISSISGQYFSIKNAIRVALPIDLGVSRIGRFVSERRHKRVRRIRKREFLFEIADAQIRQTGQGSAKLCYFLLEGRSRNFG